MTPLSPQIPERKPLIVESSIKRDTQKLLDLVLRRRFKTHARSNGFSLTSLSDIPTKSLTFRIDGITFNLDDEAIERTPQIPAAIAVKRYLREVERTSENRPRSASDEYRVERAVLIEAIRHPLNGNGEITVYPEIYSSEGEEFEYADTGAFIFREFIPGDTLPEKAKREFETKGELGWDAIKGPLQQISLLHAKGPLVMGNMNVKLGTCTGTDMCKATLRYVQRISASAGRKLSRSQLEEIFNGIQPLFEDFDNPRNQTMVNGDLDVYVDHVMPQRLLDSGGTVISHFIRDCGLYGAFQFMHIPDIATKTVDEYIELRQKWAESLEVKPVVYGPETLTYALLKDFVWGNIRKAASTVHYKAQYVNREEDPSIAREDLQDEVRCHLGAAGFYLDQVLRNAPQYEIPAAKRLEKGLKELGISEQSYVLRSPNTTKNPLLLDLCSEHFRRESDSEASIGTKQ